MRGYFNATCVDEPENGFHPGVRKVLAEFIGGASASSQLFVVVAGTGFATD
ncbi:MAG: hypothetical protein Kow0069_07680 [Promethearchaeota archaeon]